MNTNSTVIAPRQSGSWGVRMRGRRLAWIALGVLGAFLNAEMAGLMQAGTAFAQQPAKGPRRLALFVVPKAKKDETSALVLDGLFRGTADRLAGTGVERAWTSPVEDPAGLETVRTRVEDGRKALAGSRYDDALKAFQEAEKALEKCFPIADRALVAKLYKGLGLAQLGLKKPEFAKRAIRLSNVLYPGQKPGEYAYNLEARNLFASVLRDMETASNGTLAISSRPVAGAQVYVNYEFRGVSPVNVAGLSEGDHLVTLYAPGYNAFSQVVAVPGGAQLPLDANLVPSTRGKELKAALSDLSGALAKGRPGEVEGQRVADLSVATDVIYLEVSSDAKGFAVNGVHVQGGKGAAIQQTLPKDARLVGDAQNLLEEALKVSTPEEATLPPLECSAMAVPGPTPGPGAIGPAPGDEDMMIDPNSPIFRDTGKKPAEKGVWTKWWFWTAAAVVVAGAATGVYFLSRRGGESGATGDLRITIHGAQ